MLSNIHKHKIPNLELGIDMEKRKRSEAEFHLPEIIIQHIQSFLSGKEAAQSTLLSKSWYGAWLTRPNLDFNERDYVKSCRLWKFVEKTVERYEKLNLKIDSLRLHIYDSYNVEHNIAKLIMQAIKMGASDIDFDIFCEDETFLLPQEVFGSENLIRLSVGRCKIYLGADGKISCSRLKSLTLFWVHVESDTIWDIISNCPLIENLSLSRPNNVMALSPFTKFGKQIVGSVVDRPFNKLKSLWLSSIDVDTLFFHNFSSKFPCLKDMTLFGCDGYKGIQISSPSLECISFSPDKMLRVKFDVPNIRKFTFQGSNVPSLSFKTATTNWESDISISCLRSPRSSWFLKLNKLLTNLGLSKVSLTLRMCFRKRSDCVKDIKKGLPKPEVEILTIDGIHSICPDFFDVLFQCCHPIYISQHIFRMNFHKENCDFMELVFNRVMQQVGLKRCSASQSMPGECALEEVVVEFFDEAVSVWRPRLLDDSSSSETEERRIRLHLRWGR